MSDLDRFERFCEILGLRLEDFQRTIMREVFGDRREVVCLVPRGCGKTTLMAVVALYHLIAHPKATIVIAASTREQAGHLYEEARKFVLNNPKLSARLRPTRRELRTKREGRMLVISADSEKQLGWTPDIVMMDELGSIGNDDLYSALRSTLMKKATSRLYVISTAAAREDGNPLGELRARALKGKVESEDFFTRATTDNLALLEWRVPDGADIDDPEIVKRAVPASWISPEQIADQREALREPQFRRLVANQWVTGDEAFISAEEWDACAGEPILEGPGMRVIGVDAAVASDTAAICLARRDPDDVYHCLWRLWTPTRRDKIQLADVEAVTRDWADRFNVDAIVFDPRFFIHAAQSMEDAGYPTKEWKYGRNSAGAATLGDVIKNGRLRHGGADVPREHALNAEVRERDYGLVISKSKSRDKIDALMAAVYAIDEAAGMSEPRKSVYESRGLVSA